MVYDLATILINNSKHFSDDIYSEKQTILNVSFQQNSTLIQLRNNDELKVFSYQNLEFWNKNFKACNNIGSGAKQISV